MNLSRFFSFSLHRAARALRSVAIALLIALSAVGTVQSQSPLVRVGVYDNPPKLFLDNQNRPGGIMGELLMEIARRQGWTIEAVECEWQQCLNALQSGLIDLVPGVAHNSMRESLYSFHSTAVLEDWSQLFTADDTLIRALNDLNGKRIAVMAGTIQFSQLSNILESLELHARIVTAGSQAGALALVRDKQADAAVVGHLFGMRYASDYGLKNAPIRFEPTSAFYITAKGQHPELLAAIDAQLAQWHANADSFYTDTLSQWGIRLIEKPPKPWIMPSLMILAALLLIALLTVYLMRSGLRRQRKKLVETEHRMHTVLDAIDAYVYIKDSRFRYLYANHKLCKDLNYTAQSIVGKTDDDLYANKQTIHEFRRNDEQVLYSGERLAVEEVVRDRKGEARATLFSIKVPVVDPETQQAVLYGISTNISALKATQSENYRLAFYDPLTELPNRRLLLQRLEQHLQTVEPCQSPSALYFLDLDRFKHINDARGHAIGDTMLRLVARRLSLLIDAQDIVARLGGDEFVILKILQPGSLQECRQQALDFAEQLRSRLEEPYIIEAQPYLSSGSIGLTLVTDKTLNAEALMRQADTAMYRSKESGRNQITLYEAGMQEALEEHLSLQHDLTFAIGSDQLRLFVQSQYDEQGRICGAEVLLRWHHPTRGVLTPNRFIPLAESTDLITPLGDWIVASVCDLLLQTPQATFPISINVSPIQFRRPDFAARIRQILKSSGAPAHRLIFEITEGVLMEDSASASIIMSELTDLGIRFSIDDFGTGYSNLAALRRLPLYELKIDRSLIMGVPGTQEANAIVRTVLAMARQLRLHVVAEGVESEPQKAFLLRRGCHALQGYLLSPPQAIEQWIKTVHQEPTRQ
ncbi:MAG TPA: EAL domain-containing protein [Alcaligenes sp.]|nr:EAL domain-containing protein [Alcaligenes sp.]HRL26269.1 EAL domain-containing protein [Alcaligenes sp.]